MIRAIRPGRKVNIVHPDAEDYPITVLVMGEPRVLPAVLEISPSGELRAYRAHRLVQFYSDLGFRTVKLADLYLR